MTTAEAIDLARQLLDSEAERMDYLVQHHDHVHGSNGYSVEYFRKQVQERREASKILKMTDDLRDAINSVWVTAYPESGPTDDLKGLRLRVEKLAEDRKCWMDNAKANQKEYIRVTKILKEGEA